MNDRSTFNRIWAHPAYKDFNLGEKGLKFVFPDQIEAMVYDNDTCLVGYNSMLADPENFTTQLSQQNIEKTRNEIAQFSQRDADTYEELLRRYSTTLRRAFMKYRYSPPTPFGVKNELEKLFDGPKNGLDPAWYYMTLEQVSFDIFESPELRTLMMRAALTSNGVAPMDVLGPYVLLLTFSLVLSFEPLSIPLGGAGQISDTLLKAFTEMGGKCFLNSEVTKLLMENGKASGVRLKDGTEVKARQVVVSDLSAYQTVCQLIGEDQVDPKIVRRIKNIKYDRHNIIWATYAVHEPTKYKAACFNPECGLQFRMYIGPRNPDYVATKYYGEIWDRGIADRLYPLANPYSIWDKDAALNGGYVIGIEEFTAPTRYFSKFEWERIRNEFEKRIVEQWAEYAPNMTRDNIIASHVVTPYNLLERHPNMHEGALAVGDIHLYQQDRRRTIPELSDYRMPVKNYYLCSSVAHGGPGTARGSSYCCWKTIAKDFGLKIEGAAEMGA